MVAYDLKTIAGCSQPNLAAVDFHEPSLVFLTATATKLTDLQGAADHLSAGDGCAFALVPIEKLPEFKALVGAAELQQLHSYSGLNYSKGQEISLELVQLKR